ncbi:MAG: hypothetical protein JXC85_04320 [Candidatus Aenigmarchaeota archaeon]|nr:hypothetical protein [Candidatus Aenigmarchaeota archaeon]
MEEERRLTMYLFIVFIFLLIILYMANLIPPDESRFVITLRILILAAAVIVGFFGVLSYYGKWG